jgi:putative Mg2+ transporter-C (MgtC) family protein
LGAALFVLTPLQSGFAASHESVGRAIQGVAAGIGFLGAGEILHVSRHNTLKVKGLTSAASIWVTAALGVAAGCGWWQLATIATVMTLITLSSVKKLEDSSRLRIDEDDRP